MLQLDRNSLRGSIPPLITPFSDGRVDDDQYARMVEYQIDSGSHGILVNGTSSEPASLTVEERCRTVDIAIEAAKGRTTIVVATGSQSFAETEYLTRHAASKPEVSALLIVTPYYSRPPQRGLIEYYRQLNLIHDKPWMIYHIPGRAAVDVQLETAIEIDRVCPTFVGMKHASLDLGFVTDLLDAVGDDLRVFVGLEELSFPMMAVGACGLMNAVGNLYPKPLAEMCELVEEGKFREAQILHKQLFEINKAVFYDTNPIPIKYMMKKRGIIETNEHRLPMIKASGELEKRLDGVLEQMESIT